jgi:hypothetical protein
VGIKATIALMAPRLRAAHGVVFVMALALAFAPAAMCLAAATSSRADVPCHSTGRAPTSGVEQDCCSSDSAGTPGSASTFAAGALSAPAPVVIAVFSPAAAPRPSTLAGLVDASSCNAGPPGIPTYVFVSSFRI